ncbi:MBL fold metallo-hydrolase [Brucellaceae bacterium C25G]
MEQEFEPTFDFLFPEIDIAELECDRDWLEADHVDFSRGVVRLAIQSFIIKVDNLTILVDTGIGEHKSRHRPEWHECHDTGFLQSLGQIGADPDDIDLVVCTHIHVDHVGWNTVLNDGNWVPAFPSARYIFPAAELDNIQAMLEKPSYYIDSVAPIPSDMLDKIKPDHEICPGVSFIALPGHSPGMVGIRIERNGQTAILCSDALHSPFQVRHPHISSALCSSDELAYQTRLSLLEDCANNDILLIPAHLRNYDAMRIVRKEHGFAPVFIGGS